MTDALTAFLVDADVSGWAGLPELTPREVSDRFRVDLAEAALRHERHGDPPSPGTWVAAPTGRFRNGLRLWLDEGPAGARVVLVEGLVPCDDDGHALRAPELGPPDATLDAYLGDLTLAGGERVYADRGLAVRMNPENGVLLGLAGFAPTTAEDYRVRLRPAPVEERPLLDRRSGR